MGMCLQTTMGTSSRNQKVATRETSQVGPYPGRRGLQQRYYNMWAAEERWFVRQTTWHIRRDCVWSFDMSYLYYSSSTLIILLNDWACGHEIYTILCAQPPLYIFIQIY